MISSSYLYLQGDLHKVDPWHAEPLLGVVLLRLHVRLQPRAGLPSHGPRLPDIHAGRGLLRAHLQDQDDEVCES